MFVSYGFIGFLLLFFLLYYLVPEKFQTAFLLFASLAFYGMINLSYLCFIFSTATTVYYAAIKLSALDREYEEAARIRPQEPGWKKEYKKQVQGRKKAWMLSALLLNLGVLAVVKYASFALGNINLFLAVFHRRLDVELNILVPLGISFFTFQAVGYLLDVYWNRIEAQTDYVKFFLFISFFPQLAQGPISRYADLSKTLYGSHPFVWKQFSFGLERIAWGYFKKLVVADRLAVALAAITSDVEYYTGAWVFIAAMIWSVELYADFTGGIDITIGIAEACGISLRENFDRPYFSKNLAEFWRRWHISMGSWFKDYVFYPLSISHFLKSVTKQAKKRFGMPVARRVSIYISTILVWLATGLWHGAQWRYVAWGLANGVILLLSEELKPLYQMFHKRFPKAEAMGGYQAFRMLRTFLLVSMLRLFDIYPTAGAALMQFGQMFAKWSKTPVTAEEFLQLGLTGADYLLALLGTALMFVVSVIGRKKNVREILAGQRYAVRYTAAVAFFFAVLLFGAYGTGYDVQQFIYNQF